MENKVGKYYFLPQKRCQKNKHVEISGMAAHVGGLNSEATLVFGTRCDCARIHALVFCLAVLITGGIFKRPNGHTCSHHSPLHVG